MKIALCFSGQPRYLKEAYSGIYSNLIEKYSPDVFVHTWWDESMADKKMELSTTLSYNRTYYWEKNTINMIKKLYLPKKIFYQPQINFKIYDNVNYELCNPQSVHSMFYSLEKSNKLKKKYEEDNNFVYDVVIRCRFDTLFDKFDINFYDIDMSYINCHVMNHNIPNDQFAISNSKNMDKYSSVYSNLEQYQKFGWTGFIGERLLKYHMDLNNLNWNNSNLKNKLQVGIIKK